MESNKTGLIVAAVLGAVIVFGSVFLDFMTDKVVEKLQKKHCPSPYGPGVDPDKMDISMFHKPKAQLKSPPPSVQPIKKAVWEDQWEEDRY